VRQSGARESDLDAVAYTQGPGLAGALLVGAAFANSLAFGLGIPAIGVHHLEGHLLSPLLEPDPPAFPFVALLVSGGHTQLMRVGGLGDYEMLGETQDDAAGEAFDKTAKLLGLGYPGGPALAALAERGKRDRFAFPRPMLDRLEKNGDLDFSFSGLKTAVVTQLRKQPVDGPLRADVAAAFQEAVADVLVAKSRAAIERTGLDKLVVAGGVGANTRLRTLLDAAAARDGFNVFYPAMEFCTDNGAMIALAGAMRLRDRLRPRPTTASRSTRAGTWRGLRAALGFRLLLADLALLAGREAQEIGLVAPHNQHPDQSEREHRAPLQRHEILNEGHCE